MPYTIRSGPEELARSSSAALRGGLGASVPRALTLNVSGCYKGTKPAAGNAVSVAQLVERQTVDLDVAGSNPVAHPNVSI